MNFGSTATNINLLTVATAITSLIGLCNVSMFTWTNIVIMLVSFYVLNILGIWMTLHRYYSHKSFEFKNAYIKWFFTILSIIAGRGSPLGWAYLHRKHHAYSDTEQDPHGPKFLGYKLFGFGHFKKQEEEKMQIFIVKDLMTAEQLFIHKWYIAIILTFVFVLALINLELLYFAWILPTFLVHLSQNNFNYFGHTSGYRNFVTRDDSKNNKWLFPILLGEAWHNNHHYDAKNYSTKKNKYELDPLAYVISAIKK
jgi:stearoyl-CoA desaturase (delta-9 desaturase)